MLVFALIGALLCTPASGFDDGSDVLEADRLSAFAALPKEQLFATTLVSPIAVPGSVLMLPLMRKSATVEWPATLNLRLNDGRTVVGRVVRVESRVSTQFSWTSPRVVTETAEPIGDDDIVLLAPLPVDGSDEIYLGEQRLDPIWMNGLAVSLAAPRADLELGVDDLPDPTAPSEYFRAVLQAHRQGTAPSPPAFGEGDSLYARAVAGLWSAAIARLAENDAPTARRVVADLIGRAHGVVDSKTVTMAAWKTNLDELDSLLRALLTPHADGIVLAEGAKLWLENRSGLVCWVESDDGESVSIGVANPRAEAQEIVFRWPDQKEPALSAEIGPESFESFTVPRARSAMVEAVVVDEKLSIALEESGLGSIIPPGAVPGRHSGLEALESQAKAVPTLLLEHANNVLAIQVGFGRAALRPPGLGLGMFRPAGRLCDFRAESLQPPPPEWSTSAGIRRRPSGWEILVECRRPADSSPDQDRITIVVQGTTVNTVTVQSDGTIDAAHPIAREGTAVHRGLDRWRARVPLPESWLVTTTGRPGRLAISVERAIEAREVVAPPVFARRQFAGFAPLCSDPRARRLPLELSSWELSSVTLAP